jgi:fibro-slime domain-containing protein
MRALSGLGALAVAAQLVIACSADPWGRRDAATDGPDDAGEATSDAGVEPIACGALRGVVRDFRDDHPDFERVRADEKGLVQPFLGPDQKPVYAPSGPSATVSGAESFEQWYRDQDGVNQSAPLELALEEIEPGLYAHQNDAFFPLDDQGFGNQGRAHNFHFTTEIHARFVYRGGEIVRFRGDDDLWLFVNGRLALDLGGVHEAAEGEVAFDEHARAWQLRPGRVYPIEIFHAERHTQQSVFRLQTNIDCFESFALE